MVPILSHLQHFRIYGVQIFDAHRLCGRASETSSQRSSGGKPMSGISGYGYQPVVSLVHCICVTIEGYAVVRSSCI
jgi:hypothetical protein